MSALDLDAIREHLDTYTRPYGPPGGGGEFYAALLAVAADVPALLAEVERLRAAHDRIRTALDNEALIVSGIRRDMEITPAERGGEVRHLPGTPRHGMSGCPGDNLIRWVDEVRAAASDPEPQA